MPNSGFETPSLGFGNFQYGPTGGSWNFINGAGITAGGSGFTGGSFVPQGSQVAFIQSNGEFSQSLSGFQANTNYVVTFFAAQRTNCCNPGGQQFAVYLDGTLLGTFNPPLNGVYVEYSTTVFTTTAGSHILKFVGLNPGGQAAFIDHVRLSGAPLIGNGVQWLVADHLGTPRMIVDESGNLSGVKRRDYLPFGEELLTENGRSTALGYSSADGVRQQFTQKERDVETGLDYFNARYYSSVQGRFTGIDPDNYQARLDLNDPQSWNAYSYVNNNPLARVDSDGKGFFSKLKNWLVWNVWGEEADVKREEDKRRQMLLNVQKDNGGELIIENLGGNLIRVDPANMTRLQVFFWSDRLIDIWEQGAVLANLHLKKSPTSLTPPASPLPP